LSIPGRDEIFLSSPNRPHLLWGPPISYSMGTGAHSLRVDWLEQEADSSPLSGAKFKNVCITPPFTLHVPSPHAVTALLLRSISFLYTVRQNTLCTCTTDDRTVVCLYTQDKMCRCISKNMWGAISYIYYKLGKYEKSVCIIMFRDSDCTHCLW